MEEEDAITRLGRGAGQTPRVVLKGCHGIKYASLHKVFILTFKRIPCSFQQLYQTGHPISYTHTGTGEVIAQLFNRSEPVATSPQPGSGSIFQGHLTPQTL